MIRAGVCADIGAPMTANFGFVRYSAKTQRPNALYSGATDCRRLVLPTRGGRSRQRIALPPRPKVGAGSMNAPREIDHAFFDMLQPIRVGVEHSFGVIEIELSSLFSCHGIARTVST